ncbi:MAG TPA: nuclear transport factor 2 family protein [Motilibacteraceae bacterium]|nr:nuclear transport factor 2 family protein [Motilibacteraceae bacterium]
MERAEMIALVERHLKAEGAGDIEGAVAVYTEDIEHDDVGLPGGPLTGKAAAMDFYRQLTANFRTEGEETLHRYFDGDSMILEERMTGTVIGEMFGIPGHGRRVSFRILHVFDFRDGLISREQVWIDSGSVVAQLTAA